MRQISIPRKTFNKSYLPNAWPKQIQKKKFGKNIEYFAVNIEGNVVIIIIDIIELVMVTRESKAEKWPELELNTILSDLVECI